MKDGEARVGDYMETIHPGFDGRPAVVEVLVVMPRPPLGVLGDWVRARDARTGVVATYGPAEFVRVIPPSALAAHLSG